MAIPLFESVLKELQARKGCWKAIAREIEPGAPDAYYSWLTKLAQGTIKDPSVNKIQRLADFFDANPRLQSSATEAA